MDGNIAYHLSAAGWAIIGDENVYFTFYGANMNSQIQYRKMKYGDASMVSAFISDVFLQFVAQGFSQEGVDEFMKYIKPDALDRQLKENHFA